MVIDPRYRVGDIVEDRDKIEEAGNEADDELGEDGSGDVFAGSAGGSVHTTTGLRCKQRTVYSRISSARWVTMSGVLTAYPPFEMPSGKMSSLLVACTGGIAAQTMVQHSCNDEESATLLKQWEDPVDKRHTGTNQPINNQVRDKDMPPAGQKGPVEDRIRGEDLCSNDLRYRGIGETLSEDVPPSGKPAADTTIPVSRDRGPMIDTTGRRHGRSEFGG